MASEDTLCEVTEIDISYKGMRQIAEPQNN